MSLFGKKEDPQKQQAANALKGYLRKAYDEYRSGYADIGGQILHAAKKQEFLEVGLDGMLKMIPIEYLRDSEFRRQVVDTSGLNLTEALQFKNYCHRAFMRLGLER